MVTEQSTVGYDSVVQCINDNRINLIHGSAASITGLLVKVNACCKLCYQITLIDGTLGTDLKLAMTDYTIGRFKPYIPSNWVADREGIVIERVDQYHVDVTIYMFPKE